MPERKDFQNVTPGDGMPTVQRSKNTFQTPDPPPLITKKWLCVRLDLVQFPGGRPKYKALYSKVLTPEVLSALRVTENEVRRVGFKTFSREQTVALIRILDL